MLPWPCTVDILAKSKKYSIKNLHFCSQDSMNRKRQGGARPRPTVAVIARAFLCRAVRPVHSREASSRGDRRIESRPQRSRRPWKWWRRRRGRCSSREDTSCWSAPTPAWSSAPPPASTPSSAPSATASPPTPGPGRGRMSK